MTDRFNTIAGWVLFSGIVALGLDIGSAMVFHADKPHPPVHPGYPIAAAAEEGGGDKGPSIAQALAKADPAAGEKIFAKCAACHSIAQGGANGIGPNLYATVGEQIGKGKAGFAFSDALSSKGGTWTFDNLNTWLTNPKGFAPGTKMTFAGLSKVEDRANVIAYLNAQGSNLPLPKPDAAPAGADAGKAGAASAAGTAAKAGAAPVGPAAKGAATTASGAAAGAGPAENPGPKAAGAVATKVPSGGAVKDKTPNE